MWNVVGEIVTAWRNCEVWNAWTSSSSINRPHQYSRKSRNTLSGNRYVLCCFCLDVGTSWRRRTESALSFSLCGNCNNAVCTVSSFVIFRNHRTHQTTLFLTCHRSQLSIIVVVSPTPIPSMLDATTGILALAPVVKDIFSGRSTNRLPKQRATLRRKVSYKIQHCSATDWPPSTKIFFLFAPAHSNELWIGCLWIASV